MNSEELGFKDCEEDYLIPLQSRLQELILGMKNNQMSRSAILNDLIWMLGESDFRHQWDVTNANDIDREIEADAFPQK